MAFPCRSRAKSESLWGTRGFRWSRLWVPGLTPVAPFLGREWRIWKVMSEPSLHLAVQLRYRLLALLGVSKKYPEDPEGGKEGG